MDGALTVVPGPIRAVVPTLVALGLLILLTAGPGSAAQAPATEASATESTPSGAGAEVAAEPALAVPVPWIAPEPPTGALDDLLRKRPFARVISIPPGSAAGLLARPATAALVRLDDAGSQALATALDCTWQREADGALSLGDGLRPSADRTTLRSVPGAMSDDPAVLDLARALLEPWLAKPGDLEVEPRTRSWKARVDLLGKAELVRVAEALGSPRSRVPALVPGGPAGDQPFDLPESATWSAWAATIARRTGRSVGVSPRVVARLLAPPAHPLVRTFDEARSALASIQVHLALVQGAWCLDTIPPADRLAAPWRRTIAVLPVNQCLPPDEREPAAVPALAARIQADFAQELHQPGWLVAADPGQVAIVVAADVATIHRVLDWLAEAESRSGR